MSSDNTQVSSKKQAIFNTNTNTPSNSNNNKVSIDLYKQQRQQWQKAEVKSEQYANVITDTRNITSPTKKEVIRKMEMLPLPLALSTSTKFSGSVKE